MINLSDVVQWDVRTWSKAITYWDKSIDWSKPKLALELGAREGGLSLWLASKGIDVICSDYKNTEEQAKPLHLKYNLTGDITYQDIDGASIPYENKFDIIVFKSIIGGIGRGNNYEKQALVFRQILKALKPGGKLLFAENLTATSLHKALRARNKWGSYWRYVSLEEMNEFLLDYSDKKVKTTGVLATFGRTEAQKSLLTRVDECFLNIVLPNNLHYMGYGVAEK